MLLVLTAQSCLAHCWKQGRAGGSRSETMCRLLLLVRLLLASAAAQTLHRLLRCQLLSYWSATACLTDCSLLPCLSGSELTAKG
jgi:hypothetical protein